MTSPPLCLQRTAALPPASLLRSGLHAANAAIKKSGSQRLRSGAGWDMSGVPLPAVAILISRKSIQTTRLGSNRREETDTNVRRRVSQILEDERRSVVIAAPNSGTRDARSRSSGQHSTGKTRKPKPPKRRARARLKYQRLGLWQSGGLMKEAIAALLEGDWKSAVRSSFYYKRAGSIVREDRRRRISIGSMATGADERD